MAQLDIETIFRRYKDKVYRLAISIARNDSDAEDIMQNTFIKIIRNLKYFRNQSSISTWIYKIAYNEALMHLRKRKSQFRLSNYLKAPKAKLEAGLFVNWSRLPDQQLLEGELKERVGLAIRQMPIKYRMPLLLDMVEELPLKDSAGILGLKINSLKTRLRRAHLLIKSEITDYFRDKEEPKEKRERKCGIWTGFIYDYARGNLSKRRSRAFKGHIKDCSSCNSFLDNYVKAIYITRALECRDLPEQLKDKIKAFLLKPEIWVKRNTETFSLLKHQK